MPLALDMSHIKCTSARNPTSLKISSYTHVVNLGGSSKRGATGHYIPRSMKIVERSSDIAA